MTQYGFTHCGNMSYKEIADLYTRIYDEGKAKFVFYNGFIHNEIAFADFVTAGLPCWLVRCENPGGEANGVWWVNEFQGRTGMLHFCMFKDTLANCTEIGRQAMQWLADLNILDSLYGLTPCVYRNVWPMLEGIGFERVGKLKNACHMAYYNRHVDGVISTLDLGIYRGVS
jgi:hypothetical protein